MGRQVRREIPRWRRQRYVPAGPAIALSGRRAERVAREMARAAVTEQQPKQGALAATGAYRYRHQLVPFWLLLNLVALGETLHLTHQVKPAILSGLVLAAVVLLLTRHLKGFDLGAGRWIAFLIALWLPLLASLGVSGPAGAVLLLIWGVFTIRWVHHYRIRDGKPEPVEGDRETWMRLADHKKWHGKLGTPEAIPGGTRYPLQLDGIRTNIGDVLSQPLAIAAAWHKPITEAYAEGVPDGTASRGHVTLLKRGTLEAVREWDGQGVTDDGFAKIGRYADGADARIRLFAPMDGARHGLISGTSGAGKTALLELMLHLMLTSGFFYPVVLDPQEGQSLPDWRGRLPYAAGTDECMEMLTLVHEGMFGRSRQLSQMTWDDHGHERYMSFFDHVLTGWPFVAVIADEMHMLLTGEGRQESRRAGEAVALVKDIGKLGRKTGTALWPVTQVPSLEELGSQVLRSMLTGGTVIGLRTADRVSGGMLGLPADPHDIPPYFPDGSYTYGLGYIRSADRRQAIARTDMPSAEARRRRYELPALEDPFARTLARFGTALPLPVAPASDGAAAAAYPSLVPQAEEKPGRTAADALLALVTREMKREEFLREAMDYPVAHWGAASPFALRTVSLALQKLTESGHLTKTDRGVYGPPRASLTVVGGKS